MEDSERQGQVLVEALTETVRDVMEKAFRRMSIEMRKDVAREMRHFQKSIVQEIIMLKREADKHSKTP